MKVNCKCPQCQIDFEIEKRDFNFRTKKGWKIYCSKKCSLESRKTKVEGFCANCGKKVEKFKSQVDKSKTGNIYCSRSCSAANNNKLFKKWEKSPKYKNGINFYRQAKLTSVENPKCEECGYDNVLALEIHHKDKNRNNNSLDNLQILCCNCHTIKHKTGYSSD